MGQPKHCTPVVYFGSFLIRILKSVNNVIWSTNAIHHTYAIVTLNVTWLKCKSKVTSHDYHKLHVQKRKL